MNPRLLILALMLLCTAAKAQEKYNVNYDESKVGTYVLPDPLKAVKTVSMWESTRRPEILKLFEDNVYGQMPTDFDSIGFTSVNYSDHALDGRAKLKEIDIKVSRNNQSVTVHLILFIPTSTPKPGVFLLINNRGAENIDPTRKTKSEFWPVEMVIDSGYAIAAFNVRDLAPDNKDSFAIAALRLYPEQLTAPNGMRAIGAWAWGASRVMDYLVTDPDVDSKKVAVVGHSRGGKTALWAAAQDQRFAMCISNCSGNTGAKLSRRNFGETVNIINTAFPHWFTTNYKKYNNNEAALPVDQHMLISLIAPRPFYATNASKDLWADPTGTFLALKNAEKVYALYGLKSSLPASPPGIDHPIIKPPLAYHNHEGEHNMTVYDWKNFVVYANQCFEFLRNILPG
jgi:hypothetical protein